MYSLQKLLSPESPWAFLSASYSFTGRARHESPSTVALLTVATSLFWFPKCPSERSRSPSSGLHSFAMVPATRFARATVRLPPGTSGVSVRSGSTLLSGPPIWRSITGSALAGSRLTPTREHRGPDCYPCSIYCNLAQVRRRQNAIGAIAQIVTSRRSRSTKHASCHGLDSGGHAGRKYANRAGSGFSLASSSAEITVEGSIASRRNDGAAAPPDNQVTNELMASCCCMTSSSPSIATRLVLFATCQRRALPVPCRN